MRSVLLLVVASSLVFSAVGCASSSPDDEDATDVGAADLTSQERSAIMDALRATVKREVANQDIVFNVQNGSFRVAGDYCWMDGIVQLRSGGEPSLAGTDFEQAAASGIFDGWDVQALLKKENGRWTTLAHAIGSTDVWWWGIEESFPDAPRSIFPYLDNSEVTAPTERAAVMDALRAIVKPEVGNQDIVFNVQGEGGRFKMEHGYVWLQGKVQLRNGREPEIRGTSLEELAREGDFDGWHIEALLEKDGLTWKVLEHGIGSTDVWWEGLAERYPGVPLSLLPEIAGGTDR